MRRPLVVVAAATALALLVAPAGAAVKKPKAPPIPACAKFADPKADSGLAGNTQASDPSLDITGVTYAVTKDSFVVTIAVDKVSSRPTLAAGNRYQATFGMAGKAVDVYYKRSPGRDAEENAFYQQGIRVDGTFVPGSDALVTSTQDDAKNTVSLIVASKSLLSTVGAKASPAPVLSGLTALAMGSYIGTNQTWDTADGGAAKLALTLCK